MSRNIHQIVGYGVATLSLFALSLSVAQSAQALPFASRVGVLPAPHGSQVVDQRTEGGQALAPGRRCAARTRLLIRSGLPFRSLEAHYQAHRVAAPHGLDPVSGRVRRASEVEDLQPEWHRYRNDPEVFVAEFTLPGTPGLSAGCLL